MFIDRIAGFSLLEVLVSLLLLAFIILGFDAMQVYSLRSVRNSYYLNIATGQLNNMAERLHALGENSGLEQQIQIWNKENQQLLPKGKGLVVGHYPFYEIILYWGESSWERQNINLTQKIIEVPPSSN
jgi:hypothetical protein